MTREKLSITSAATGFFLLAEVHLLFRFSDFVGNHSSRKSGLFIAYSSSRRCNCRCREEHPVREQRDVDEVKEDGTASSRPCNVLLLQGLVTGGVHCRERHWRPLRCQSPSISGIIVGVSVIQRCPSSPTTEEATPCLYNYCYMGSCTCCRGGSSDSQPTVPCCLKTVLE